MWYLSPPMITVCGKQFLCCVMELTGPKGVDVRIGDLPVMLTSILRLSPEGLVRWTCNHDGS